MYSTRTPAVASMLLTLAVLPGCIGDASAPATDSTVAPMPLTPGTLRNATYMGIPGGPATLIDGRYEGEPFTSDSASRPVVTLVPDLMATGDLTGDGIDDAVVALAYNAGGSGVFMHLAIMREDRGKPDNVATISLGDRVRITALGIAGGKVIADLAEHGPDDPMCCPTNHVRRQWQLHDGEPVPLEPMATPAGNRFSGHLVWGPERRSFTECGGERQGWVINQAGEELVDVYNELTTTPYQAMFVEVRGEWSDAPARGFGAEYDEALRITELIRAASEGLGCRLELDGVLFIARGNEPFWHLQIREDGISMRSMDAPGEIEFPAPRMSGQPPRVLLEADGVEKAIRISLEQRRCVDSMSGARYAWAASVNIDDRQLEGCAAEGI